MKKITLFYLLLVMFSFQQMVAQDLQIEDFESLTIGNAGGQGGLSTFSGADSDYQIVYEDGNQGNVLEITGPADDDSGRFLWKDFSWASRTPGNDFIQVEYDFYTGPTTTSLGSTGIQLYNSDYTVTIGGFRFVPETKVLTGLVYFDSAGDIGTYIIDLGTSNTELVLSPNTWYRVGFAFNTVTGEVIWKGPGFYTGINGAAAGIAPFEADFTVTPDVGNTVANVAKFDSLLITAAAAEDLLGINDLDNSLVDAIKLYPNPANDVINLSASNKINLKKLEVLDVNGRIIKSTSLENITNKKINISELNSGLYLINIYSSEGMTTKKFIKQ